MSSKPVTDKTPCTQSRHETVDARKALRHSFRAKRNALSNTVQKEAAHSVVQTALDNHLFTNNHRIAIYLSHDGELDTRALIEYLWDQGKQVYLPVLHPFSPGYLLFLHYTKNTPMTKNKFGIGEPVLNVSSVCPVTNLDIIFTPLVAFDEQGNRMGMGGGFFDRTLQSIANTSSLTPKLIGLAHDVQKTLSLPTQVWDIPLPEILTPSTLFTFSRK